MSKKNIENQYLFHDLVRSGNVQQFEQEIIKNEKSSFNPFGKNLSLNDVDNLGLSPMHISIMTRNIGCLKLCIEHGCDKTQHCERTPPLILLCHSLSTCDKYDSTFAKEAFELLYNDNCISYYVDTLGRTVYHMAASYGLIDILECCYRKDKESLNLKDNEGNTSLHYACQNDQVEAAQWIMSKNNELLLECNKYNQTCLHTCLYNSSLNCYTMLIKSRSPSPPLQQEDLFHNKPIDLWRNILEKKRQHGGRSFPHEDSHLGLYVSKGIYDHITCKEPISTQPEYPPAENPDRLRVLLEPSYNGSLLHNHIQRRIDIHYEDKEIDVCHLLKVHDINYIMKIINLCKQCSTPTAFVQLDNDTSVSRNTFKSARIACQTICTAIDDVMSEKKNLHNAFVCIRPPGHHVGVSGSVDNEIIKGVSNGFCLFNNICVAAAYARSTYPSLSRIAILDIDIHHGNGTQQCVEAVVPFLNTQTIKLFNSTIESSTYVYKPWKDIHDGENLLFASVQGYGSPDEGKTIFYPGSGKTESIQVNTDKINFEDSFHFCSPTIINVGISKLKPSNGYPWREAWRKDVFPKLCDFKPDIIFVSAGFDGHIRDGLNRGFGTLNEDDYSYIIAEIIKISNVFCPNRTICVLEGGYAIEGAGTGSLAQSVQAFVEGMTHTYYSEYSPKEWALQSSIEQAEYTKLTEKKNKKNVKSDQNENHSDSLSLNTSSIMDIDTSKKEKEDILADDSKLKSLLHQEDDESEVEFDYEVDEEDDINMEDMNENMNIEEDEDDDNEDDDDDTLQNESKHESVTTESQLDTIKNKESIDTPDRQLHENEEEEEEEDDDDDDEIDDEIDDEMDDEIDDEMDDEIDDEIDEEEEDNEELLNDEIKKVYNPLIQNENGTLKTEKEQEEEKQNTAFIAGRSMRKRKTIDYAALNEQLKKEEEELKKKRQLATSQEDSKRMK